MPTPTEADKKRFLLRVYFGVSNNPNDDFNPYEDLAPFTNAPISSMRWGADASVRNRSKIRFSVSYSKVLYHYNVLLKPEDIFHGLSDESKLNYQAVDIWYTNAIFQ